MEDETIAADRGLHDRLRACVRSLYCLGGDNESNRRAAAALMAASQPGSSVAAIVSRGGRPELATNALPTVRAPTLIVVGSLDGPVIEMNERALAALETEKQLTIVQGASHLFEEPGTLDEVVRHATEWFLSHRAPITASAPSAP